MLTNKYYQLIILQKCYTNIAIWPISTLLCNEIKKLFLTIWQKKKKKDNKSSHFYNSSKDDYMSYYLPFIGQKLL